MEEEERALRRMVVETELSGLEPMTGREIKDFQLPCSEEMQLC